MEKVELWTDAYLDAKRLVGDPLADDLVRYAYEKGYVSRLNDMFRLLQFDMEPGKFQQRVQAYIEATHQLPDWFEQATHQRACQMFAQYEIPIMAALLFASLPMSFAAAKGAHVLTSTYRMTHNPYRRVLETIQMLRNVMQPDGLDPNGSGIQTLQKVRLLHASTRYLLTQTRDWDVDYYGIPINQEDLAGSSLLFSYIVVTTTPHFAINMTEQEQTDFLHMWNFISYVMGTQVELLPDTKKEAQFLAEKIRKRQFAESPDGIELMQSLMTLIHEHFPPMPGAQEMLAIVIHHLCGDEVADILGVEKPPGHKWEHLLSNVPSHLGKSKLLQVISLKTLDLMFKNLYESEFLFPLERNPPSYSLPSHLTKSWKLEDLE